MQAVGARLDYADLVVKPLDETERHLARPRCRQMETRRRGQTGGERVNELLTLVGPDAAVRFARSPTDQSRRNLGAFSVSFIAWANCCPGTGTCDFEQW